MNLARLVAITLVLPALVIGFVGVSGRAHAQLRGGVESQAKAGTTSNPVPPARLLLRQVDESVVIAAVIPPKAGACVVTRAHSVTNERVVVAGDVTSGSLRDTPGAGEWAYELWAADAVEPGKNFAPRANSRPIATASIDLRPVDTLIFLGGTAKRGMFEHVAANGVRRKFMVAVGAPIEAVMLAETMRDGGEVPKGEVVDLATGLKLVSVSIMPSLSGDRTETTSAIPGASGDSPALGLDGKPLQIAIPASRRGPQRLAAVISAAKGSEQGGSRVLAEGEAMTLGRK